MNLALDPRWTDYVSAISTLATALAAIFGGIFGLLEYRRAMRLEFHDKRAFIVPRLNVASDAQRPRVYLVIRNYGDTPAFNVTLDFAAGQVWHWVKPADYPFLAEQGGITAIGPGEEIRYFLGELSDNNGPFNDILQRDVFGSVSFDHPVRRGKRWADPFRLSYQDGRYRSIESK